MERLLPLDRRFLQPAPKGLGDPKGEVELVPDAWTVFEPVSYTHLDVYKRQDQRVFALQVADAHPQRYKAEHEFNNVVPAKRQLHKMHLPSFTIL